MSAFKCEACEVTFDSRGQFTYHTRNCKDFCVLKFPNGKVTVKRGEDGMFMCNCTHSDCPRPFKKIESLKKHIQRAGTQWRAFESVQVSTFNSFDLSEAYLYDTHYSQSI